MIVSLPPRGIGAAVLAAGLLLAGCSSDSDVPKTMASAPDSGTQVNTDTGSGGSFPDVNTVPSQRPTSTIQDLNQAPEGLSGAQGGTQYGEPLVGGPTSSAPPPAPPPPPEPTPAEQLPPNPEAGLQTQHSDDTGGPSAEPSDGYQSAAPASSEPMASSEPTDSSEPAASSEPTASSEPIATPEVAEPQPMEPAQTAEAIQPPAPSSAAPEGQTIQGTTNQPAPDGGGVQAAPMAAMPPQPATPVVTPQESSQPVQPEAQLALSSGAVRTPSQPQMPTGAYEPNYAALAPDAYGISFPQPVLPPYQASNPAQAMYASPPTNYGGANGAAPLVATQSAMVAPTVASNGQPSYGGQPVGLIYFREGSSELSSDDRDVLKQIAEMQHASGGIVHVVGHASMRTSITDDTRNQQANQRVSEARADAVARQLMTYGVPQDAIQTAAAGDSQPLYSEATPNGEAANRRAEVYLSAY